MASILVRRATEADLGEIGRIQRASPGASDWPVSDYLAYDLRVAELEGAVAGFLVSRAVWISEIEILNLAVEPRHRRGGVGRALI